MVIPFQIESELATQVYSLDFENCAFRIFEPRRFCMLDCRDPGIGAGVSADNVRCAAQIQRSASQLDSCDPKSADFDAANAQAVLLGFIK